MAKSSNLLSALAATALSGLLALSCQAEEKQAWVIRQMRSTTGHQTICLREDGLKVIHGDVVLISAAPDWRKIVLVNKRARNYFELPLAKLDDLKIDWAEKLPDCKLSSAQKDYERRIASQEVLHFEGPVGSSSAANAEKMSVWTARDIKLCPEQEQLLKAVYGRKMDRVPFLVKLDFKNGTENRLLTTDWCLRRKTGDHFFAVPSGFKCAASREDVESPKNLPRHRVLRYPPVIFKRGKGPSTRREAVSSGSQKAAPERASGGR